MEYRPSNLESTYRISLLCVVLSRLTKEFGMCWAVTVADFIIEHVLE